jgi:uncharacterized protein (DUF58 family)
MASVAHWTLLPDPARRVLGGLRLKPRILAEGRVSGIHPSSHQGQSLEFSDLKGYAFGDDPHGVDWKVYARTDKLYVRRFLDETNLTAHLVLDASGSMATPAGASKHAHAASMLAGLAYVLLRQRDEVGVRVAHARRTIACPARGVPSHLAAVADALLAVEPSGETDLGPALAAVVGEGRRKGMTIVASDMLTAWEPAVDAMRSLGLGGHAVLLLHVLSVAERTFPFRGPVVFRSPETGESVLTDARGLRRHYLAALERFVGEVRSACHDAGVFYHPVDMTRPPHEGVAEVIRAVSGGTRRRVI